MTQRAPKRFKLVYECLLVHVAGHITAQKKDADLNQHLHSIF